MVDHLHQIDFEVDLDGLIIGFSVSGKNDLIIEFLKIECGQLGENLVVDQVSRLFSNIILERLDKAALVLLFSIGRLLRFYEGLNLVFRDLAFLRSSKI
jgi:hypothetical protein